MLQFLLQHTPLLYFVQSVWRDEAYSILVSQHSLLFIVRTLTFETPLYYMLLHVWMNIFGSSEIATRSLSLVGFGLAIIIVIEWAYKLFHKHWLATFLPVFFALNPMLLYYAFEIRTYGWVTFFAVLTMFAYEQKKWKLFTLAATLGFYTHSYFPLVPLTALIHAGALHLATHRTDSFRALLRAPIVRSFCLMTLLIAPWLIKIAFVAGKLEQSWYYPVDARLLLTILGNMFIGYEGTPPTLWPIMPFVSLGILLAGIATFLPAKHRPRNSFFFSMMMMPLIITIGISFVKPLFVSRYVLFVTVSQVFLICFALEALTHKTVQKLAAAFLLIGVVVFNLWYPARHPKKDIRKTIMHVNKLAAPTDHIYAEHPLVLFETMYYSAHPNNVFWYNPLHKSFPWYVGEALFDPSLVSTELPNYPKRAFIVRRDGTFYIEYKL